MLSSRGGGGGVHVVSPRPSGIRYIYARQDGVRLWRIYTAGCSRNSLGACAAGMGLFGSHAGHLFSSGPLGHATFCCV